MDPSRTNDPKFTFDLKKKKEGITKANGIMFSLTGSEMRALGVAEAWGRVTMVGGGMQLSCFYFLMAATAFIAASSRSSAAVMGRPLSVRIRLASCTLVPETKVKRLQRRVPASGWAHGRRVANAAPELAVRRRWRRKGGPYGEKRPNSGSRCQDN